MCIGRRTITIALLLVLAGGTPAAHSQGIINVVAGGGPNNIPALSAGFDASQIGEDKAGNLYFVSPSLSRIFAITPAGQLTVFAGNGVCCSDKLIGEGGPAINATLSKPAGAAVDSLGNVFIADTLTGFIREVSASTGLIHTVVQIPNGRSNVLPTSLAVDGSGNLFVTDADNSVIWELVAGTGSLKIFAGGGGQGFSGDGGPAATAQLSNPSGLFADGSGN